ncbi:MAG: hypothetical protein AB1733_01935 [Thermodesulfobacteriota bacterium]
MRWLQNNDTSPGVISSGARRSVDKEVEPVIRFFSRLPGRLVPFDGEALHCLVPLSRRGDGHKSLHSLSYGAYLGAIEKFVSKHVNQMESIVGGSISAIDVISEKHGSDYHPARLEVTSDAGTRALVVNVAFTERGRTRLIHEMEVLQLLAAKGDRRFLPEVYFSGEQRATGEGDRPVLIDMFIGEWLEGFHEFHLTSDPGAGLRPIAVWDTDHGTTFISAQEAKEIYRQAAFVLTYYYDIDTFAEIYPWHHAAGDFVVSRSDGKVEVRLISARQYAPRIGAADTLEHRIEGLLLFFANLTVRMRLDRFDGVGEIAWAGDYCLDGAIQGFFDAMQDRASCDRSVSQLWASALNVAAHMSPDGWAEVFSFTADSYPDDAPDAPLIRDNLVKHILRVYRQVPNFARTERHRLS